MVRKIEKGVTIITLKTEVKNINGYTGVSRFHGKRWRVDIQQKQIKYIIGVFDDFQDAVSARQVAEYYRAKGLLHEWIVKKPHGNSDQCAQFWENEFSKLAKLKEPPIIY